MFTGKKYPVYQSLLWTYKPIIFFACYAAIPVLLQELLEIEIITIPWLPVSLIGTAVAFYLGFKNNASYERLWEARKIYGGIVNNSRTYAMMVNTYVTNQFREQPETQGNIQLIKEGMIKRHVAWLTALRFQLRQPRSWENWKKKDRKFFSEVVVEENQASMSVLLGKLLGKEESDRLTSVKNKAAALLNLQMEALEHSRKVGLIDDFRHMEMGNVIKDLMAEQGKAERIKNFPFPRQYASMTNYFVWLFIFLLPYGMLAEFETVIRWGIWFSIPFCTIVSWVFHTMEKVGDYSENPFEGGINDVPITTISLGIEQDVFQIINSKSPLDYSTHQKAEKSENLQM